MTEAQFQRQVLQLAGLFRWACYHTHDSRRSKSGFPDLVLVKPGRPVIFAELKSDTGETSAEQDEWLTLLRTTPSQAFLWRPKDLIDIARILGE